MMGLFANARYEGYQTKLETGDSSYSLATG